MKTLLISNTLAVLLPHSCNEPKEKKKHQIIEVQKTLKSQTLDRKANEIVWNRADWHQLDQNKDPLKL
ncbi:MAG: hypothetical protein QM485_05860 [Flavobacteriaceae bacterium]